MDTPTDWYARVRGPLACLGPETPSDLVEMTMSYSNP